MRRPIAKDRDGRAKSALSQWDRDAALTTARILLEIKAVNFRPEEPIRSPPAGNPRSISTAGGSSISPRARQDLRTRRREDQP